MSRLTETRETNLIIKAAILQAKNPSRGDVSELADDIVLKRYLMHKALVGAVTSADLVGTDGVFVSVSNEFLRALDPMTIIGRLSGYRPVPFFQPSLSADATVTYWTPENNYKPLSAGAMTPLPGIEPRKVTALSVYTDTVLRGPTAEQFITTTLRRALAKSLDSGFLDGAGSITDGANQVAASGSTASAIVTDLERLLDLVADADKLVLIAHWRTISGIAMKIPGAIVGGTLFGVPYLTSSSVPWNSAGASIVALDQSGLDMALGEVEINVSREATLAMNDNTGASGALAQVSLYQTNSVAFLAERFANWRVAPNAVAELVGADY